MLDVAMHQSVKDVGWSGFSHSPARWYQASYELDRLSGIPPRLKENASRVEFETEHSCPRGF